MRTFWVFILAAGFAGCSVVGDDPAPLVRLTNEADTPVLVRAWKREATDTLDPTPVLPRAQFDDRLVAEGTTVGVEPIRGGWERTDDLRLFLYAAPDSAETASLRRVLDVSARTLYRQGYRVTIDRL